MRGGVHLSEEDERAEREARERLRHADHRMRQLGDQRAELLTTIRRLSDEQRALYDTRAPKEERVEEFHREYQAMGQDLQALRAQREALRPKMGELLRTLRDLPREARERGPARPEQIRKEIERLELQQQTVPLPLPEENALIDRIRALRKELAGAEVLAQAAQGERTRRAQMEEELRLTRAEFERLGMEFDRLRALRIQRFEAVKSQLVSVGQVVGEIREKARLRGELFKRVEELNGQMAQANREIREALQATRDRRREARDTIRTYNRGVRESVSGTEALSQAADENLELLLRSGRVRLGG